MTTLALKQPVIKLAPCGESSMPLINPMTIDDWMLSHPRRKVEFDRAGVFDEAYKRGLICKCQIAQYGNEMTYYAYGFGMTTADAFWDAVRLFNEKTADRYR